MARSVVLLRRINHVLNLAALAPMIMSREVV